MARTPHELMVWLRKEEDQFASDPNYEAKEITHEALRQKLQAEMADQKSFLHSDTVLGSKVALIRYPKTDPETAEVLLRSLVRLVTDRVIALSKP